MHRCVAVLCIAALAAGIARAGEDWPQFRGPRGDGVSEAVGLPLRWSETENVLWRVRVPGKGRSSPVVMGDAVWLTAADESLGSPELTAVRMFNHPEPEAVYVASRVWMRLVCLGLADGKRRYDVDLFRVEEPEPVHRMNSYATPTPVVEAGRVYCDFGTYGTACVDAPSGRVLWKQILKADHLVGPGSSPVLWGDLLILVRDGADVQYLTALNKQTGSAVWKTDRPPINADAGNHKKAFATPLVFQGAGRTQMVVPGAQWICSYDPATGEELWRVRHGRNFSQAPRPVYADGLVYVCTGCPATQLWAIRVDGRGDVTETHVAWRATSAIPTMSSPVLVGRELYCVSDMGILSCFDAQSGKLHWRERIGEVYAASPLAAEGRIYLFSREGKTLVIRAGRELAKLAENQIDGTIIATPAVAGKDLLLRTDSHVYCIGQRP